MALKIRGKEQKKITNQTRSNDRNYFLIADSIIHISHIFISYIIAGQLPSNGRDYFLITAITLFTLYYIQLLYMIFYHKFLYVY